MLDLKFPAAPIGDAQLSSLAADFHLHPHYRSERPVDAALLKIKAGSDDFITEKYADQIGAILAEWSAGLRKSPQDLQAVERVLASTIVASPLEPVESRALRTGKPLEIRRNTFGKETTVSRESFVRQFRAITNVFSRIVTAEFQVTSINAEFSGPAGSSLNRLRTRVRYELAGSGTDFHREQRVGHWDLEWESVGTDAFRLRGWQVVEETRSRATNPIFADITYKALGHNRSYSDQLVHGVDYWRTILDGACGVDIYGHNGVSVADIDGDGFDDLYVCQPAGLPNRLFRNRGDGTFEDITEASGLGILENTACALFADFDNDGRQDAIIVRTNGPLLFLNQGGGKFRRKPDAFQFATPPQGTFTGAAVSDYDRDGWLDIYFCLYVFYQGADQYKYPLPYYDAENGPPNFMFRNQGDGTFRDVTAESGLSQNNTRYSFCCGWNDYNGDGWPDLYVVNDFGRKNLYRNNGDGTFTDVAPEAGVEDVGAGMSVCWCDYDNDGSADLYVGDMWTAAGERVSQQKIFKKDAPEAVRAQYRKHSMGNSLFRGAGNKFEDATVSAGVGMGRWSWSSDAWDFDHDGFPDLYIANGMISGASREGQDLNSFFWRQVVANSPNQAKPSQSYERGWAAVNELIRSDGTWSGFERNVFYANNRDGTFSDVSGAVGLDFIEDGRAFALGDFDLDGRLEVVVKNRNGPQLRIAKNIMEPLPASIAFRLRGTKSNRDAIGAVVTVQTESGRQIRTLQCGSGFLSQHSKDVFFGLGEASGPVRATIRWPSGLTQELDDLPPGHRVWVKEGSTATRVERFTRRPRSLDEAAVEARNAEAFPAQVETWLLDPVAAPEFSLSDLNEKSWTLAALLGRPVLLYLWTTKSAACLDQLRSWQQVYERHWMQDISLITVNVDDAATLEQLRALVRARRISFPVLRASDDMIATYNILYRYLFDRHRDLTLPTSFLLNDKAEIVKVYQGAVNPIQVEQDSRQIPNARQERLAKALPFPGASETFEFGRNSLSLGSIFFQRGYLDQAAAWFQRALQESPESVEALYGLGSVYLNRGENAEARKNFERTVRLPAGYPDTLPNAWNNLGLLATREGRTEEAIKDFQEALRLSPEHLVALNNLGNAYRQQQRWEDARANFEHALAIDPGDAESNYGLAMVFARLDDVEHAYEYLQNALKTRPAYPEALNNLGVLYLRTQRRDQAMASFEESIRVAPGFDQSYLNLAKVYAMEGQIEKARAVLLELLKQHPDHAVGKKMLEELSK